MIRFDGFGRFGALFAAGILVVTGVVARAQMYVPYRVHDNSKGAFTDFESMLADVSRADVVFVGEQHDDPNTHRLELMIAQGVARRRAAITISLEMFERDVQGLLTDYLAGRVSEDAFLSESRPWPRYAADYRPIVEFAREKHWPVIAANVPRNLASEVSKSGLDALRSKSGTEKTWFAADLQCPTNDNYFRRFSEAMGGHGVSASSDERTVAAERQTLERFYQAQCLKDETMAESIARAWVAQTVSGARPLVIHYNGSFHSDFSEGTVSRTARRLPGNRIVVISMLPIASAQFDSIVPDEDARKQADYLIYTVK